MRIGAHVSTAGGVSNAFAKAEEIGAEAIQIFASSPRAWAFKPPAEDQISTFKARAEENGISPIFLHGRYRVNVGGTPDLVEKSIASLTQHINAAGELGALGVIFHGGRNKGVGFNAILEKATTARTKIQ